MSAATVDATTPTTPCTVVVREGDDDCARFTVPAGAKVLHEMIRCNVRAVPVGCRGGGCGVCRVRVLAGEYDALRMSRKHISEDDLAAGVVLACRIVPRTDLVVECAPAADDPTATSNTTSADPTTTSAGATSSGTTSTITTTTEPQEH